MKKKYTRESLMRYSKADLVEEVLIARHNWQCAEESLANQAKGYESICKGWKPERHGYWQKVCKRRFISTNIKAEMFQKSVLGYGGRTILNLQCSVCRCVSMVDATIRYDYCPHCGAKMDLEENENV